MRGKGAARDLGFRRFQRTLFRFPLNHAAVEQCRVIAMPHVVQRVVCAGGHGIPIGGVNHHARIVADTQLLKCLFEFFRRRQLGISALHKVLA